MDKKRLQELAGIDEIKVIPPANPRKLIEDIMKIYYGEHALTQAVYYNNYEQFADETEIESWNLPDEAEKLKLIELMKIYFKYHISDNIMILDRQKIYDASGYKGVFSCYNDEGEVVTILTKF